MTAIYRIGGARSGDSFYLRPIPTAHEDSCGDVLPSLLQPAIDGLAQRMPGLVRISIGIVVEAKASQDNVGWVDVVVRAISHVDESGVGGIDSESMVVRYCLLMEFGDREIRRVESVGSMKLPRLPLDAYVAALEVRVRQLEEELSIERRLVLALRSQFGVEAQAVPEPQAPVPAAIEPLPKELEPILGRNAIWALVRPEPGTDNRSVIERHEVFWKRFDEVLEARGPEGSRVLRTPLQDYLEGLAGLQFRHTLDKEQLKKRPRELPEKQSIVARLNFMMRSLGLRASYGGAVGPLAVSGPSLRIQASRQSPEGKQVRVYTGLGPVFPERIGLAEEPLRKIPVVRKVTKSYRPSRKSKTYKYLGK